MLNSFGRGNWFQKLGLKTGMANCFCWVRIWRTGGTPSPVISKIILTRGGLVVRLCATGTLQYSTLVHLSILGPHSSAKHPSPGKSGKLSRLSCQ